MKLYEVQTFYGTRRRTFQHERNAKLYVNQLINLHHIEPELIEVNPYEVTRDEYIYTDIAD